MIGLLLVARGTTICWFSFQKLRKIRNSVIWPTGGADCHMYMALECNYFGFLSTLIVKFLVKIQTCCMGKNRLFNDWIMQAMAPHSLGRTTLLHKFCHHKSITMIFFYD